MKAYRLKISIKNSKPPIWRRCIVPAGITYSQLSILLNEIMGWCGYHLFEFEFVNMGVRIQETPDAMSWDFDYEEANRTLIDGLFDTETWCTYTYDFGDDWQHRIEIEEVIANYPENYPRVLKFKGECPPEDCGGIWGYYELLNALENPGHPEHESMKEWFDNMALHGDYDLAEINERLRSNYPITFGRKDTRLQSEVCEGLSKGNAGLIAVKAAKKKPQPKSGKSILSDLTQEAPEHAIHAKAIDQRIKNLDPVSKESYKQMLKDMMKLREPKLENIFSAYRKEDLKQIAAIHSFPGVSYYNKQELILKLSDYILQKDVMERYFINMDNEEIEAFQQAIKGNYMMEPDDIDSFDYLLVGGYVGVTEDTEIVVPVRVAEAYKLINTKEFHQKRKRLARLWEYCETARLLYGIAPLEIIVNTYNGNERYRITEDDIYDAHMKFPVNRCFSVIEDGRLIDKSLLEDNGYEELLLQQGDKPYYLPDKQEVEDYARAGFSTIEEAHALLLDYMQNELGVIEADSFDIVVRMQLMIRNNCRMQDIYDMFHEYGVLFGAKKQLSEITPIINDIWNNTRMLHNRGYKPIELADMERGNQAYNKLLSLQKSTVNNDKVIDFNEAKKKKVYPNDPCPCGSGKKYKHCCGRT